jgi:acyl-coenzyme A synthetase/AMP-(fatty) acid ligase
MSGHLGAHVKSLPGGQSPAALAEGTAAPRDSLHSDGSRAGPVVKDFLSPEPILAAADAFQGSWVDLDRSLTVHAAAFARGWRTLATNLSRYGLDAGDRVIMAVGNGPIFPAALAAILSCGGSPLLVHCDTPVEELRRTAARFAARFVLCDMRQQSDLAALGARMRAVTSEDWLQILWARLPDASGPRAAQFAQLAGVPLHPTSGTTGHPRIAARPGAAAMAEARHWVESVGIDHSDTILDVPPMSHAYAFGACAMTPLLTSARLVSMRRFSPKLVFRALEEYGVTLMPTVPVTLDVLMFGAGDRLRRPGLRVITAGSPLSHAIGARFKTASGITVRPLYGSTETGIISVTPEGFDAPSGCVGLPMNEVEVKIQPTSAAAELGDGVGRVFVRSTSMMAGYVSESMVDDSPLAEGWFRTGDIGRFDSAGMLHLLGRETDVINVYGMKVVPSEVEEVICAMPDVVEVKVYAGQRGDSQCVKAAVVGKGKIDAAAIRAHCEKHLVYYKRPEKINFLEKLPRTPSGKVICADLP